MTSSNTIRSSVVVVKVEIVHDMRLDSYEKEKIRIKITKTSTRPVANDPARLAMERSVDTILEQH